MTVLTTSCTNRRSNLGTTEAMRRVVLVVCAALLFIPLYVKSRPSQNISARPAFHVLSSGRILIQVSGEVRYPGIYGVSANIVADTAIKMAQPLRPQGPERAGHGTATPLWDGAAVNLTSQADGMPRIRVGLMTVAECIVLGIPLDLSQMNEADFDRLPGIGPALAKRIVEYRQKNGGILRISDLDLIDGIGEKKLEAIRKYVQLPVNKR